MEKNEQNEERSTGRPKKILKRRDAMFMDKKELASLTDVLTDVQKVPDQTKGNTVENSDYLKVPFVELPESIQGTKTRRPESAPKKGLQTAVKQAVNESNQLAETQKKQGAIAKKPQEKLH